MQTEVPCAPATSSNCLGSYFGARRRVGLRSHVVVVRLGGEIEPELGGELLVANYWQRGQRESLTQVTRSMTVMLSR